jgi:hypothetical protein
MTASPKLQLMTLTVNRVSQRNASDKFSEELLLLPSFSLCLDFVLTHLIKIRGM